MERLSYFCAMISKRMQALCLGILVAVMPAVSQVRVDHYRDDGTPVSYYTGELPSVGIASINGKTLSPVYDMYTVSINDRKSVIRSGFFSACTLP